MKWCKNNGMCVLNGDFRDDEEGSYAFIEHGQTVIDYAIVNVRHDMRQKKTEDKRSDRIKSFSNINTVGKNRFNEKGKT